MMKKKEMGLILILILAAYLLILSGCGASGDVNLKGALVTVGSWWQDYDTATADPRNEGEEQELEWKIKAENEHGFKVVVEQISGFNEYLSTVTHLIMSGNKKYSHYQVTPAMAMTLYKQGLLYPVSDSKAVDFSNRTIEPFVRNAYDGIVSEYLTLGGKTYGWRYGLPNDGWGQTMLYFNPRLLKEAGLDPEYLYDLQASNNWTWDTFMDVCRKLTRDTNNDGITDIWAIPIDETNAFLTGLITGNGGDFVTLDSNGKAVNAINSANVIEAIDFLNRLVNEGLVWVPDYSWGFNWTSFVDQNVAMTFDAEWRKGQMNENFEAGYILPPRGPRSSQLRLGTLEGCNVIPAIFSPAEVDVILKASEIWYAPTGADWQGGHYWASRNIRDVTETIAISRDERYLTPRFDLLIPGYPMDQFVGDIRSGIGNISAAQLIEIMMPSFQSAIDDFNK